MRLVVYKQRGAPGESTLEANRLLFNFFVKMYNERCTLLARGIFVSCMIPGTAVYYPISKISCRTDINPRRLYQKVKSHTTCVVWATMSTQLPRVPLKREP